MKNLIVYVSCSDMEEARMIGKNMVSERFAACVNIIPSVNSFYWWENKVTESDEVLLIFKTVDYLLPVFKSGLRKLHSYSVPEIVAVEIFSGNDDYITWLQSEVLKEHEVPDLD